MMGSTAWRLNQYQYPPQFSIVHDQTGHFIQGYRPATLFGVLSDFVRRHYLY